MKYEIGMVAAIVALVFAVLFGIPIVLQLLWNWGIVSWLGVPSITYWQTFSVWCLWGFFLAGTRAPGGGKKA